MNLNLGLTQQIINRASELKVALPQLAYILATAYWETNRTMQPVREAYWVKNAEAWRKKNLRYYPWYGRGLVQLTWEDNYKRAGRLIGQDLTTNPDRVMEPKISVEILIRGSMEGWFTGRKVPDYISGSKKDYVNARRVINGTDKASEIAGLARQYETALSKAAYRPSGVVATNPAPAPVPTPTPVRPPAPTPTQPPAPLPTPTKTPLELFLERIRRWLMS
jgi:putative chitinase